MCRFPWFYTPAVPGALAPVVATDDMTQEVGVRNCRLYTRPGDAQTQQFEQRLSTVENDVGDLQLDTSDLSGDVADLELRVDALEQGGGGGDSVRVYRQAIDTSFVNHYRLRVDNGFVPETIDLLFRNGGTYVQFHMVRLNDDYYSQSGIFIDNNGDAYVVYNGTNDRTQVNIEIEGAIGSSGTPVSAVVIAKKVA